MKASGKGFNLYHVKDGDRPMFVVATSWNHAVMRWRATIVKENPKDDCSGELPSLGIDFVCDANDLII